MTDKVQELQNTLFSHYLLQDHDEIEKNTADITIENTSPNVFKGVIEPEGHYALDNFDLLGYRSPLYLKSQLESLAYPNFLRHDEALKILEPTIEFLFQHLRITKDDYPFQRIQKIPSSNFKLWRSPDTRLYSKMTSHELPLICDYSLVISKEQHSTLVTNHDFFASSQILYQQKLTALLGDQNYSSIRANQIIKLINEIYSPKFPKTQGLYLKLPQDFTHEKVHHYTDENQEKWLIFPFAITEQQLLDIYQQIV